MLLGFPFRNFSVAARNLKVGDVTTPCLKKHVKMFLLRLNPPRSDRRAVPSDCYESEGRGGVPMCAHILVHYNISCVLDLLLKLTALTEIPSGGCQYFL